MSSEDKVESRTIYDLLAVIHRDGGHYTGEHGVNKSFDAAVEKVMAIYHAQDARPSVPAQEQAQTLSKILADTLDDFPNEMVTDEQIKQFFDFLANIKSFAKSADKYIEGLNGRIADLEKELALAASRSEAQPPQEKENK